MVLGLVSESVDGPTVLWLIDSSDADMADGSLEFDKRVSMVVLGVRKRLAVGTEVSIVTYGTLVTDALDERAILLGFAERTITIDTIVACT